jgi:hypothetical protein
MNHGHILNIVTRGIVGLGEWEFQCFRCLTTFRRCEYLNTICQVCFPPPPAAVRVHHLRAGGEDMRLARLLYMICNSISPTPQQFTVGIVAPLE